MKKLLLTLILTLFLIPTKVAAANYEITNYNVQMTVNQNNSIDIIENLDVNFTIPQHGIYRSITDVSEITRTDGSSYTNYAKVNNIKANRDFRMGEDTQYPTLMFGNDKQTYTGPLDYAITYTYDIGKEKNPD